MVINVKVDEMILKKMKEAKDYHLLHLQNKLFHFNVNNLYRRPKIVNVHGPSTVGQCMVGRSFLST
jgi:hypothetical protein